MIIGIAGKSRSGKSTAAIMLGKKIGFPVVGVADGLKQLCSELFDIPIEDLSSVKKDELLPVRLTEEQKNAFLQKVGLEDTSIRMEFASLRKMLQYLGTDIVRKHDPLYWIKLLGEKDNVIIADIRFTDEVDWIKSQQGILYYVDGKSSFEDKHPSENDIKTFDDFTCIPNHGTLQELQQEVDRLNVIKIGENNETTHK
jgi:adenylate kinase family enzyme